MVSAAIAYDDLALSDGAVIDMIASIIARHPDRWPFDVAIDRTKPARQRNLLPSRGVKEWRNHP